ncbi:hypothetical protein SAMN05443248_2776 [Bradyrhizobium erythrophlei]|jgi:hypothetical protein|uniref:Uncharacterized protein n=1 Tax=Bradyrhizobium erythrophlei TaxID=1437360 RepID=A0A1M5MYH8_9BRAD|nr:hypothetical protein SAMN05443248_2776 [Bradyrhizobium erythrophlei]
MSILLPLFAIDARLNNSDFKLTIGIMYTTVTIIEDALRLI